MDTRATEENPTSSGAKILSGPPGRWDQIKVPGLRSSMSMSDLVNHIGHCIAGQTTPGSPLLPTDSLPNKSVLEELTQHLLGDSQVTSASDEQSLMSRVNSLCCLIQHKDPAAAPTLQTEHNNHPVREEEDTSDEEQATEKKPLLHVPDGGEESNDPSGCRTPSMSRKESYGELLTHLPRIASLPQFLFNIFEDSGNQAR